MEAEGNGEGGEGDDFPLIVGTGCDAKLTDAVHCRQLFGTPFLFLHGEVLERVDEKPVRCCDCRRQPAEILQQPQA